jgi:hypothetical protein
VRVLLSLKTLQADGTRWRRPFAERTSLRLLLAACAACLLVSGCKKSAPPAQAQPQQHPAEVNPAPSSTEVGTYVQRPGEDVFALKSHPDATIVAPLDPATLTESERKFGRAPKRDASVEYQPDIILMEEGDKAIRSFASDGMTWTFDASAPHVNEFQMGKIVFATGRAVGRIIMLKQQGNTVAVILGPIQLTDVIKNGNFAMDAPLDIDKMTPYVSPDFPQPQEAQDAKETSELSPADDPWKGWSKTVVVSHISPSGKWTPATMTRVSASGNRETFARVGQRWSRDRLQPAVFSPGAGANRLGSHGISDAQPHFLRTGADQGFVLPSAGLHTPIPMKIPDLDLPAPPNAPDLNIEGGETRAVGSARAVGVQYTYGNHGIFLKATGVLEFEGAHIRFFIKIADGKALSSCGMDLSGAVGVRLHLNAHTTEEFKVNLKKEIWLPIQFSLPISGAVPLNITFDQALIVNSAFSAKNAVMNADGEYLFTGGLTAGLVNGQWLAHPSISVSAKTDIGNTLEGISVGINSLVLGAETRVMVGLGAGPFNTGLYVTISYVGTMLRQSDAGWPCRQATIESVLYSGIGYSVPKWVADAVNFFLGFFTKVRMERVGSLLKGPVVRLFHGDFAYPQNCATPKGGS